MALIKKSKLTPGSGAPAPSLGAGSSASRRTAARAPAKAATNGSGLSREAKVSERLAAATEQLASGLGEASAAAEELRRSMEQIASGASEAAGAAQEQLRAIQRVVASLNAARNQADSSRRRTEAVEVVLAETGVLINNSVRAVERNGERQAITVGLIAELERRAQDIAEITRTVSRISDQTNLLALNAAIEAARAGDHGRGFAVVADEVRALAETSEKSAQEVQSLATTIQTDVRDVVAALKVAADTAVAEAKSGAAVASVVVNLRSDMTAIAESSSATLTQALEVERAAGEAEQGAELVASAAEEQSAASTESQSAIQQQAKALDQGQSAAQELSRLAESVRAGRAKASAAEDIGSSAEELSATIQELSSAAREIMAALEQINRGSQQQAAATQQTSAALAQIEKSAKVAQQNAGTASDRTLKMEAGLKEARQSIDRLIAGVVAGLDAARASLSTIGRLDGVGRKIEKIVDGIGLVVIQTSMLAVSGSVEAARAGDAGRGFATVSGDIRGLAREAAESVERGKDGVRGILDQIGALRRDLEQIAAAAEIEVQNNRSVLATFEKVSADVGALRAANTAILQGAETIQSASAEAATGARQIAAAAEEASNASRQASTASSQQAQGAEDLAAAIEEIASLAEELKQQNG